MGLSRPPLPPKPNGVGARCWLARLQTREYTLRATGWVRVVAGLQSLLSIYLIAIWVLTYFGRPFQ